MNWLREPDAEPIPGYRLISPLGTGGFGEVWKCNAPGNILKAVKFVYGNLNSMDGDAYRAEQELKALQKMKEVRHPFILSVERIDIIEGDLAIVMELADRSLHDLLQQQQAAGQPGIPRLELLRYIRDAADGLDHLNERHGLQHLDVKPRNLFLIGDRVKVADFGLVKNLERQSSSGLLAGVTPIYAAPETFSGKFTRQSDQYGLAIVYIELLTGNRPFNGKNIRTLALQHVSEPPNLSMVPAHDRPALERALAKDPAARFPSCMAFVQALLEADPQPGMISFGELPLPPISTPTIEVPRTKSHMARRPSDSPSRQGLQNTMVAVEMATLRPTVVIGVGEFGRRALLDLRCRLLDRFGDLTQVPVFRFLYIDADPQALHAAQQGEPEIAMRPSEVFPLPLQPAGNYRRRVLEHLNDWLPREKLHGIPRSLQPQGSRALGRLAFHDNYLRFMTRLRREVQVATHPESLAQSVSQTGMMLRDNQPRVYVLAGACGGSAGMLVDLAYAVSRQMSQLHLRGPRPQLFLFCGAPGDPATPPEELANVYATLTELNHYQASDTTFSAQYGPDSMPHSDTLAPFASTYLLTLENRSPQAQADCLAHLASYLSHELTTVLGNNLEAQRTDHPAGMTGFRSFGTHSIWFPRGLLLRVAARKVCADLSQKWMASALDDTGEDIENICVDALSDPGLQWESLAREIERAAAAADGTPPEILARLIAEISDESARVEVTNNPAEWARHAVDQLEEWVGSHATHQDDSILRRSKFSLVYHNAVQHVSELWERRLMDAISPLMNHPGHRTARMETAVRRLIAFCEEAALVQSEVVEKQRRMVDTAREQLRAALEQCRSGAGTFSRLLGVGLNRAVRIFLEQIRGFAYARLAEDTLEAGAQFFRKLGGRLQDRLTDLGFIRHRLRTLHQALVDASETESLDSNRRDLTIGKVLNGSSTVRVVLPDQTNRLEAAAEQFLRHMSPDMLIKLDEAAEALVLAPLGGLQAICRKNSDLSQLLMAPLIDQTVAFLSQHLPSDDVARVEASSAAQRGHTLEQHIQKMFRSAKPMVQAAGGRSQTSYLLHPGSAPSQQLAATALTVVPNLQLVAGSNPTDLTFCREQGFLSPADLGPLLALCQSAYEEMRSNPVASPHARFDVPEWLPLEV